MSEASRYFIAIIPPQPIFDEALKIKKHFEETYGSKASLNSPPHVTLHMPFEWKDSKEELLTSALRKLCQPLKTVQLQLSNFGCFAPRVIFIDVVPSSDLFDLQKQIRRFCKMELGLFNADYKDLPFRPHLTVAFRDLKKPAFANAWGEFQAKKFEASFLVTEIYLLKHMNNRWEQFREFKFDLNSAH